MNQLEKCVIFSLIAMVTALAVAYALPLMARSEWDRRHANPWKFLLNKERLNAKGRYLRFIAIVNFMNAFFFALFALLFKLELL